jgi:hypothetical protein
LARFRLRFLLQEFDLPRGVTVIGRSLDCNLTIEDPLVSRQHARIVVDDDQVTVEDLGSRNGVRVNGQAARRPMLLSDGDRIRIGTQDLVLCRVDYSQQGHSKTTGVLRLCAECRLPYPREMVACPNCEATEQMDEDTLSGKFGTDNQTSWGVLLLIEALERALTLGRVSDAERIARRASGQVEELVAAGGPIDGRALTGFTTLAAATTLATNDPTWVVLAMDFCRRTGRVPPLEAVERIAEAAAKHRGVVGALRGLLDDLRCAARVDSPDEVEALARLEQTRHLLDDKPAESSRAGAGGVAAGRPAGGGAG